MASPCPPLAQCQADADAWGIPVAAPPTAWDSSEDEFNDFKRKMDLRALTSIDLNARNDELMQCVNTDRLYSSRYSLASQFALHRRQPRCSELLPLEVKLLDLQLRHRTFSCQRCQLLHLSHISGAGKFTTHSACRCRLHPNMECRCCGSARMDA